MLGLQDMVAKLAKASRVCWYWQILRRDEDNVLKRALDIKVNG